jgi:hypothetical protein
MAIVVDPGTVRGVNRADIDQVRQKLRRAQQGPEHERPIPDREKYRKTGSFYHKRRLNPGATGAIGARG